MEKIRWRQLLRLNSNQRDRHYLISDIIREILVIWYTSFLSCSLIFDSLQHIKNHLKVLQPLKVLRVFKVCIFYRVDFSSQPGVASKILEKKLLNSCLKCWKFWFFPPIIGPSFIFIFFFWQHSLDLDHEDDLIPEQMRCLGDNLMDYGVYLLG